MYCAVASAVGDHVRIQVEHACKPTPEPRPPTDARTTVAYVDHRKRGEY
jgi:hypothetical protein